MDQAWITYLKILRGKFVKKGGPGSGYHGPRPGTGRKGKKGGSIPSKGSKVRIRNLDEFTERGFKVDLDKVAKSLSGWDIEIVGDFPGFPFVRFNPDEKTAIVVVGYQGWKKGREGLLGELNHAFGHELGHLASWPEDTSEEAANEWAEGKEFASLLF